MDLTRRSHGRHLLICAKGNVGVGVFDSFAPDGTNKPLGHCVIITLSHFCSSGSTFSVDYAPRVCGAPECVHAGVVRCSTPHLV